jgi:hypothetical protein
MVEDPIVAEEKWAEEGHLELRVARVWNNLFAVPSAVRTRPSGLPLWHVFSTRMRPSGRSEYSAVHTFAVALKAAVVARDLIPSAEIARKIHRFCRLGRAKRF